MMNDMPHEGIDDFIRAKQEPLILTPGEKREADRLVVFGKIQAIDAGRLVANFMDDLNIVLQIWAENYGSRAREFYQKNADRFALNPSEILKSTFDRKILKPFLDAMHEELQDSVEKIAEFLKEKKVIFAYVSARYGWVSEPPTKEFVDEWEEKYGKKLTDFLRGNADVRTHCFDWLEKSEESKFCVKKIQSFLEEDEIFLSQLKTRHEEKKAKMH
ncbi:MAG: hypothetical protein UU48_C0007G0032 [Candidatus Uhrbacteria bacterium GW2011_GWF2_41_16]|uniref:Uncharacterized protein n=2 Tax=Candidatus Uhriibacteriota TaxID=1752732 RepID=A0A0G0VAE6_9BACT|nr:MAG: hypothetical protein UU35_C0005G0025 [Candidatus Uhrbacteria bacterium GW2011_GWC2_41_11]KKR97899.1 MAG: hypothetical protein UU48_C0007G0032 [Candidatus Uhrbacteria bacterium GW2011_GWF2_41_16]HBO99583.1 hypothetical protein [Candidatus Uhrbacteria bacterium]